MNPKDTTFLTYFPGHCYRYIDQTGLGRPPVSSTVRRDDLNLNGYEAYFTVNGFKDAPNAKLENCSSLNAFFVDIDGRKEAKELEQIKAKLDPTFILETKNGYHIYWVLDEPIYKDEMSDDEWKEAVKKWERIEQAIVLELKADLVVKDVPRILRIPDTYYWKKSGAAYLEGTEGVLKIKGIYKETSHTYSMDMVADAFPVKEEVLVYGADESTTKTSSLKKYAEDERRDFFNRVNKIYPLDQRDSFKELISGKAGTVLPGTRNQALVVTASLMKQAGWTKKDAFDHFAEVGWHGMEKEAGGIQEIQNTVNSAYSNNYTYSYKNDIIARNMSEEESKTIQEAYTAVAKERKETDKIRFTNYEREVLANYPYLRKNEIGIVFNYENGVYKMLSDMELSNIILAGLYDDMLWGYRTKRNVSDKVACLLSIIPNLNLTNDRGWILNLKNGLLNIYTRELKPHTPAFVSLVQSPVAYDPDARAPVWEGCIKAWMEGPESEKKTQLIQQFSGYCLSSSMEYDKALFLVGDGGNGKSTFVDTISRVIGPDGTSHIDLEGLYGQYGMKGLIGKRLNIIEEVHGNYYQSNKLKKLISGEPVTIDIKYKDQFSFRPQAKFIFAVNIMPRVDDTSTATERRMCAINFRNNFRNNPNTALRSDVGLLASELPGILNWMLDGAKNLSETGSFVITQEQIGMLSEYRQENSSVEGFIAECVEKDEAADTNTRDLYDEYKAYCVKDGRKFKGAIAFIKEMRAYGQRYGGFVYRERSSGHVLASFQGIKVYSEWNKDRAALKDFNPYIK